MTFEHSVELFEVLLVKVDDCFRLEDALVAFEFLALGKGPDEFGEAFDAAGLLEHLADAGDLLAREAIVPKSASAFDIRTKKRK